MDSDYFQKAIIFLGDLLRYDPSNPFFNMMLGDCYLGLTQLDEAIASYEISAHFVEIVYESDKRYGDDFRFEVKRNLSKLKTGQKIDKAVSSGDYTKAISYIDDFLVMEPDFGYAYLRRGYCHERLTDYTTARKDYRISLDCELPFDLKEEIQDRINYIDDLLGRIPEFVKLSSSSSIKLTPEDKRRAKEYQAVQEKATLIDRNDVLRFMSQEKDKKIIMGFDEDGFFFGVEEALSRVEKHPERDYTLVMSAKSENPDKESVFGVGIGKVLSSQESEKEKKSREKRRARNERDYKKHREERKSYQREYDTQHKVQKKARNSIYYMFQKVKPTG